MEPVCCYSESMQNTLLVTLMPVESVLTMGRPSPAADQFLISVGPRDTVSTALTRLKEGGR